MLPLLRAELFRLSRRAMPRVLLLIAAGVILLLYLLLWTVVRTQSTGGGTSASDIADLKESLRIGAVRDTGLSLVYQIGTIMAVILAASTIGTEYGWGTIRTLVPRAPGRAPLIWAKLASLALFVALVTLIGAVVAILASVFATATLGLSGALGDGWWGRTLLSVLRTAYVMLPYATLAFALSVWTRSTAAGIGVGLAVLFLEGILTSLIGSAGGPFEHLKDVLLSGNVQSLLNANAAGVSVRATTSDTVNPWQATAVLAAYTAAFVALALWRFRTRDITSG